ncbi:substrate-binding domain-containing protein [Acidisoma cladoniae]|jgi:simple sugar transport system substrate-binding protein|uniref:substrate-binding domain-containing protein n=1 Tax=Acidisoma cladoniae TaxID=3040935 RepID=UPI00254B78D6|nr:substrate-binding domain-containing protein [Acidisoma sp. PAMC 29798]
MITRRRGLALAASSGLLVLPGLSARAEAAKKKIAVVVKIGGIPWFNAMEVGIKRAGAETGTDAWMVGPTQADAAQQVAAIEDLIARKVDVIGVVPNDADALVPVFQRAHAAGIKIITHESPLQQGNDWDLEFTTPAADGVRHFEALAQAMGGVGQYMIIVGSLTVPQHRMRADAAVALQKAKYPKMELVGGRFGVGESLDDSYRTVLDQIRAHPKLKGVLAFGSQGPIGGARAVDDRGKIGKIFVVGPFSPGQGAKYIRSGAITVGYIWNPLLAGETIVRIGALILSGKSVTNGMVLPEVGAVTVDPTTRVIMANKIQPITKETIDSLVALGL